MYFYYMHACICVLSRYIVKLSSNEGPFTAFAVQARTASEFLDVDAPFVGQFVGASGSSDVRNCGIVSYKLNIAELSLIHTNTAKKRLINFTSDMHTISYLYHNAYFGTGVK